MAGADLAERLRSDVAGSVMTTWLGQAGFAVQHATTLILIDPYLSDSLADKYRGTVYPHVRLEPVPVDPARLVDTDLVLCSHRHTDHMDPATLVALSEVSSCRFVVPAAWVDRVTGFGIDRSRVIGATEGRRIELDGIVITPVLAAHEELQRDESGHSLFLGYVLELGGTVVYHSGDCVPFPEQVATLRGLGIQTALLPVNGRDAVRLSRGVPGNFRPAEACRLAIEIGAERLIVHHFGMFDFNTVDPEALDDAVAGAAGYLTVIRPELGRSLRISDQSGVTHA